MIDYWQDGHIDCKDYAIYNSIMAKTLNATNITWLLTPKEKPNHVFIIFEVNGTKFVADNDKLYRIGANTSTH